MRPEVIVVCDCGKNLKELFSQNYLTGPVGLPYTTQAAQSTDVRMERKISMMMTSRYTKHNSQWLPTGGKLGLCLRGLGLSSTYMFGGEPGRTKATSIDNRRTRQ